MSQGAPLSRLPSARSVGIVGAGLFGRLLALALREAGWAVTLFDRDDEDGRASCGYVGAGMLAPISELESAEPLVARLGAASLPLWERWIARLDLPVFFQRAGTLAVAHPLDAPELARFRHRLQVKTADMAADALPVPPDEAIGWHLDRAAIDRLEPHLNAHFREAVWLPGEGQLDNRQLYQALAAQLRKAGVDWRSRMEIQWVLPHHVDDGETVWQFDWVADCRGLGARADWQGLRGVRGEILRVHAPEVTLHRPVRLMHPRHPLYVAPRENQEYLIGATAIESEDLRPVTAQSAMELLSAAFAVHAGFAEASILEMQAQCRPALPDNQPRIELHDGLVRINGLYRHGFLVSPQLVALVRDYLQTGRVDVAYAALFDPAFLEEERPYAIAP